MDIEYSLRAWQQDDMVPRNMSSQTDVFVLKFRVIFPHEDELIIEKRFMVKHDRILREDLAQCDTPILGGFFFFFWVPLDRKPNLETPCE